MSASGEPWPPPAALTALEQVRLDWCAGRVVGAMRDANVRPILLKGPAVARWLYGDEPRARPYGDIDLLVAPSEYTLAQQVLGRLGFERPPHAWLDCEAPPHAEPWVRALDGANVDLHRTLHGCEHVGDARVWEIASADAELLSVGGIDLAIPSEEIRALNVVLELSTRFDGPGAKARVDLDRALALVDRATWARAADAARALGVAGEMRRKLRSTPAGATLADNLELPCAMPRNARLLAGPPGSWTVDRLATLPGVRARLAYGRRKLFPPPAYLARTPFARPGRAGLAAGYAARAAWAARRLPAAIAYRNMIDRASPDDS